MNVIVLADAVKGAAHMQQNIPCQDKYSVCTISAVTAVVLCDGAGSCSHSHLGAQAVSSGVARFLAEYYPLCAGDSESVICERVIEAAQLALKHLDYPLFALSCTLVFFVTDGAGFLCGNLGDGRIFRLDGSAALLLDAERGEFHGETYFVTSRNAAFHLNLRRGILGKSTFVLVTDGAGDLLYDEQNGQPAAALDVIGDWTCIQDTFQIQELLRQGLVDVFGKATSDDVSMVLIYSHGKEGE